MEGTSSVSAFLTKIMPACRFGTYELHDLVVLDSNTVGVIISIAKDSCKVLTNKVRARPHIASIKINFLGIL